MYETQGLNAVDVRSAKTQSAPGASYRLRLQHAAIVLTAIVVIVTVVSLALAWSASNRLMHPAIIPASSTLKDYPGLRSQRITFRSQTGTLISARFFPGSSRATIILSHGYGDDQDSMLPWAAFLNRAGFSVLTYDMRGSGGSGGSATLGALEPQDLISAVNYLVSRKDVDRTRIGALGFSIGGAISIVAAARDSRIKAVVDDSGLSDVREWLRLNVWSGLLHPQDPLSYLSVQIAKLRLGVDITAVRPMDKIARISPRPVFIIQGTADSIVPSVEGEQNFAAARNPKQLWLVTGAAHGQTLLRAGIAYQMRVVRYLQKSLHVR